MATEKPIPPGDNETRKDQPASQPLLNVVLVEPEIPPNTGNIIRLCANTGARLHLVGPLGFPIDDAKMRRAGLDYREFCDLMVYPSWTDFCLSQGWGPPLLPGCCKTLTTRGRSDFLDVRFAWGDWVFFGSETRGLSAEQLDFFAANQRIRLPMQPQSRSLNLSNAVAVTVYEAWRQHSFKGGR
jgi:tRNA (cytidine/uridine-2'-O-)-methyltransferase